MATEDVRVDTYGELHILTPWTARARDWLRENTSPASIWYAGGIVVEGRYLVSLIDELHDEGMAVRAG